MHGPAVVAGEMSAKSETAIVKVEVSQPRMHGEVHFSAEESDARRMEQGNKDSGTAHELH